jgi:hypothetical protein
MKLRHTPIFGLALAGCISTSAVTLDPTPRPQTCASAIRVYVSENRVGQPYTDLALIKTEAPAGTNDEKVVASMREKAAKLGANGLVLLDSRDPSTIEQLVVQRLGSWSERRVRALAIAVPDSAAVRCP